MSKGSFVIHSLQRRVGESVVVRLPLETKTVFIEEIEEVEVAE